MLCFWVRFLQNRKLFYFWTGIEKIWVNSQRIIVLFTPKIVSQLSKIRIGDRRYEIRDPEKTYSGSRIQGSKRQRILDPGSPTLEGRNENYKKVQEEETGKCFGEERKKKTNTRSTYNDTCAERMELLCQERIYYQRSMMNMFLCTGTVRRTDINFNITCQVRNGADGRGKGGDWQEGSCRIHVCILKIKSTADFSWRK